MHRTPPAGPALTDDACEDLQSCARWKRMQRTLIVAPLATEEREGNMYTCTAYNWRSK